MKKSSELPGVVKSLRRSLQLGFAAEPALFVAAFLLTAVSYLPQSLVALWLKLLADGAVRPDQGRILFGALAVAGSVCLTWLLKVVDARVNQLLRVRT